MYLIVTADDEKMKQNDIRFLLNQLEEFLEIKVFSNERAVCEWFQTQSADILMEQKFCQKQSDLLAPEKEEMAIGSAQEIEDMLIKRMKQDIRVKDMDSLWGNYRRLCDKYLEKPVYSQLYIKFIFANLLKDCYDELPQKTEHDLNVEIEKLYHMNEFSKVMQIVEEAVSLLERQCRNGKSSIHPEIEAVKQYIYQNYEKELGVELLAEKVYMAPAYLSTLFKKETGQKLSNFIKTVRMERAKELLEETHRKIVDISTAVGYANVSYFCQSFREYFGVSPQKFRSKGKSYTIKN